MTQKSHVVINELQEEELMNTKNLMIQLYTAIENMLSIVPGEKIPWGCITSLIYVPTIENRPEVEDIWVLAEQPDTTTVATVSSVVYTPGETDDRSLVHIFFSMEDLLLLK